MSFKAMQRIYMACAMCNEMNVMNLKSIASSSRPVHYGIAKIKLAGPRRMLSSETVNMSNYPADLEVSYDEFKHVEALLPKTTVPKLPQHTSYPTPSGWVPPNDELRSQHPYLVRRTKNHVIPVYAEQKEVWGRIMHHIVVKGIEGDIWKLESELRHFLMEKHGLESLNTQVHEVSRTVRVRGMYHADIAQFLLDRGM